MVCCGFVIFSNFSYLDLWLLANQTHKAMETTNVALRTMPHFMQVNCCTIKAGGKFALRPGSSGKGMERVYGRFQVKVPMGTKIYQYIKKIKKEPGGKLGLPICLSHRTHFARRCCKTEIIYE